jgi:circadian clock protein KaiB
MPKATHTGRLGPSARQFKKDVESRPDEQFVLRLFVSGLSAKSRQAIDNVRSLCETHLPGRYDLQIIDIYQQPRLAKDEQLIAAPTLIKKLPLPLRRLVGNMHDPDPVLVMLGIAAKGKADRP